VAGLEISLQISQRVGPGRRSKDGPAPQIAVNPAAYFCDERVLQTPNWSQPGPTGRSSDKDSLDRHGNGFADLEFRPQNY
jgi:hypothetical protein